jgi:hypothetical protein
MILRFSKFKDIFSRYASNMYKFIFLYTNSHIILKIRKDLNKFIKFYFKISKRNIELQMS